MASHVNNLITIFSVILHALGPTDGVGVYSLARLRPLAPPMKLNEEQKKLFLMRACKVLAHEIGHIFGLKHCIYFKCMMNGSNHEVEVLIILHHEVEAKKKSLILTKSLPYQFFFKSKGSSISSRTHYQC